MIRIVTGHRQAEVTFPYAEDLVAIIRTVPGRRWHPDRKVWTIDLYDVEAVVAAFLAVGQQVTVDGELRERKAAHAASDAPVIVFIASLPERLRDPVWRALARVLHPDAGGDHDLMQQLNRARELYL